MLYITQQLPFLKVYLHIPHPRVRFHWVFHAILKAIIGFTKILISSFHSFKNF